VFRRGGNREILLPLAYRRSNNALLLSGNHVLLRTDLSERLPIVQGDSVQLQQVLLNLILNAADALADVIDRPRELTIVTRPEAGGVRVEVKDTELALRKRSWSRSFSRFTRRKPMAWAWAFRSAARLSRTTEASSSRSPTMAQELHFVSLSPNSPDLTKRKVSQDRTTNQLLLWM
jgi:hypothetical protein